MTESHEQHSQESAEQLKQESAQTADAVNSTAKPEPEQSGYDKKLDGPDRPSV
ncbi:hypothetical protein [Paenibacillus daejeonensis]|uniref:hypothetical protein n=1 Tax=Paenibacillus daejeonensis TaxID=135193 RepID=UPI00037C867E|nr:hypothetical protein [Paenibacillus daejeonensis]